LVNILSILSLLRFTKRMSSVMQFRRPKLSSPKIPSAAIAIAIDHASQSFFDFYWALSHPTV
jgi:hypothetical protein